MDVDSGTMGTRLGGDKGTLQHVKRGVNGVVAPSGRMSHGGGRTILGSIVVDGLTDSAEGVPLGQ